MVLVLSRKNIVTFFLFLLCFTEKMQRNLSRSRFPMSFPVSFFFLKRDLICFCLILASKKDYFNALPLLCSPLLLFYFMCLKCSTTRVCSSLSRFFIHCLFAFTLFYFSLIFLFYLLYVYFFLYLQHISVLLCTIVFFIFIFIFFRHYNFIRPFCLLFT